MAMRELSPFLVSFLLACAAPTCLPAATPTQAVVPNPVQETALPVPACTLDVEGFKAQLASQIIERFKLEGDLELTLRSPWRELPAGTTPWVVRIIDFPNLMSGNFTVRYVLSSGAVRYEQNAVLSLNLWRDIYVVRTQGEPGDVVDALELDLRRTDMLTASARDTIVSGALATDLVYRNRVQPGRALTTRDVTRRSLVRKGQEVDVLAVDGALSISMKGLALQSGSVGDTILVRNTTSKRDIRAQVVSEGRVEVKF